MHVSSQSVSQHICATWRNTSRSTPNAGECQHTHQRMCPACLKSTASHDVLGTALLRRTRVRARCLEMRASPFIGLRWMCGHSLVLCQYQGHQMVAKTPPMHVRTNVRAQLNASSGHGRHRAAECGPRRSPLTPHTSCWDGDILVMSDDTRAVNLQ